MKEVIILKGLPASGKSTYAKELIDKNPSKYKRINKDDLRAMFDNGKWSKSNEKFILEIRNNLIEKSLLEGYSVIVDDTNLSSKHEKTIQQIINKLDKNINIEIKFFDIDVKECIERDLKRPNSVGEKVIRQMYNQFLKPKLEQYNNDENLPKAIICDIDGTLAKMENRSPYDISKVSEDRLNIPIYNILNHFKKNYNIILISGRDSICRKETEEWLEKYNVPYNELFMRVEGDIRKDNIIKEELFNQYIKDKYYVEFILDDRDRVVEMWRDKGFTCLQVDYGNF